jgi:hydrogenase-4 component F
MAKQSGADCIAVACPLCQTNLDLRQADIDESTGEATRLPVFYGLLLWFLATMLFGCVTNNVVMLYVAVEATTLTSGLLVAFYWDRRALEAGYKYLMLLTIGITFALFGCVLVYAAAAATGKLEGGQALLLSEVRGVVGLIPSGTALIAVAFLIVGFGTKAGIAPFHPWLPDAHAEAPTPVSVLLSGVMIKMAVYAWRARSASSTRPGLPWRCSLSASACSRWCSGWCSPWPRTTSSDCSHTRR